MMIVAEAIEERVFLFVARERSVKRAKLSLSSRLNQDLGMDGDDAVEFFEKFRREFQVDFDELTERWSEFFGSEGVSLVVGLAGIACLVGCVAIAALLYRLIDFLPLLAWEMVTVGCFLVAMFYWASRRKSPLREITISDLIDAARAGKWERPTEQNGGAARSSL
jgi:hypothetical protein